MILCNKLMERVHDKQDHLLFETRQKATAIPRSKKLSLETRRRAWQTLFKSFDDKFWFEQESNKLFVCFKNGLRIEDGDRRIAFSAYESKDKMNQAAAISVVKIAANHLYRRGDYLEISSIYTGAAPYIKAFEQSTKQVRQLVNQEQLMALATKNK